MIISKNKNKFKPEVYVSRSNSGVMFGFQIYRYDFNDSHLIIVRELIDNNYQIMKCPDELIGELLSLEYPGEGKKVEYPEKRPSVDKFKIDDTAFDIIKGTPIVNSLGLDDLLL